MAKKDEDDFEAQLGQLDKTFDEDDDQEDALGGFPGDSGGFPGGDEPEPEFDAEDLFAEDFGEEQPEPDAVEEVDYEPDHPDDEEEDAPDFEEEEDETAEDDFSEDDPEAEDEGQVDEEEEDPFANLDEDEDQPDAAKKKSNAIFYGATSVIALLILGAGYSFVLPMFTGGGAAPVPVSQYEAEAPPPFQPGNNTPAAIPQPERYEAAPVQPPALPQPPAGAGRVQVPGYPTNMDQGEIMPDLGGAPVSLPNAPVTMPEAPLAKPGIPSLPGLPAAPLQPKPALPGLESTPEPEDDPFASLDDGIDPVEAPEMIAVPNPLGGAIDKPTAQPLPAPESADPVMAKLEDLLSRFADLEKKIVTEDEVVKMVDAAVAKVEISSGDESFTAIQGTVQTLSEGIASLEARLDAKEAEAETIAQLEARFEEKIAGMAEMIASYEGVLKELKEKETVVAKTAEKVVETKTKKLQQTVSRQQAEIVSLKSRGGSYVPPAKPEVHTNYRLAGLSNDQAWIETPGGVSRFSVGQNVPGIGMIKEFRAMDGHFAVITTNGIIVP